MTQLKSRLSSEQGISLIVTLVLMVVLMVSGATVVHFSSSNARTSEYASDDARALQFAEAGLNHARSTLWASADASDPSAVGSGNFVLEGAAITFSGALSGTVWTLTATATLPNPTGAAGSIIQTVSSKVEVTPALDSVGTAWAYFFGDCDQSLTFSKSGKKITGGAICGGTESTTNESGKIYTTATGCTVSSKSGKKVTAQGWTIWAKDSGSIDSPLFSRSNLCVQDSAIVSDAPIQVHDSILIDDAGASIGAAGAFVSDTHIGVGCALNPNKVDLPCNAADQIFSTVVDGSPLAIVKPPVDLDLWYTNSSPGPLSNCTTGSVPGGFDNNAALRDTSLPTFDLTPGSAYSCETASGKLIYNPGSPGTLEIEGTVFFDGDIVATNSATYSGRGTIYSNGTILIQGATQLCGVSSCDGSWNPDDNLLVLVSGEPFPGVYCYGSPSGKTKSGKTKSGESWETQTCSASGKTLSGKNGLISSPPLYGFDLIGSAKFQGAVYAVADVRLTGSSELWGSAIFRLGLVEQSAQAIHMDIGTLLPGMPLPGAGVGAAASTIVLSNVEGSFSGG